MSEIPENELQIMFRILVGTCEVKVELEIERGFSRLCTENINFFEGNFLGSFILIQSLILLVHQGRSS